MSSISINIRGVTSTLGNVKRCTTPIGKAVSNINEVRRNIDSEVASRRSIRRRLTNICIDLEELNNKLERIYNFGHNAMDQYQDTERAIKDLLAKCHFAEASNNHQSIIKTIVSKMVDAACIVATMVGPVAIVKSAFQCAAIFKDALQPGGALYKAFEVGKNAVKAFANKVESVVVNTTQKVISVVKEQAKNLLEKVNVGAAKLTKMAQAVWTKTKEIAKDVWNTRTKVFKIGLGVLGVIAAGLAISSGVGFIGAAFAGVSTLVGAAVGVGKLALGISLVATGINDFVSNASDIYFLSSNQDELVGTVSPVQDMIIDTGEKIAKEKGKEFGENLYKRMHLVSDVYNIYNLGKGITKISGKTEEIIDIGNKLVKIKNTTTVSQIPRPPKAFYKKLYTRELIKKVGLSTYEAIDFKVGLYPTAKDVVGYTACIIKPNEQSILKKPLDCVTV